jgi:hypothetical protein
MHTNLIGIRQKAHYKEQGADINVAIALDLCCVTSCCDTDNPLPQLSAACITEYAVPLAKGK